MRNAILIFILLLLSSCEKIVKFNEDDVKFDGLMVNALASTDSVFSVSVTKAYPFYNKQAILGGNDHWVYQALQEEMYEQFTNGCTTRDDYMNKVFEIIMNFFRIGFAYSLDFS